MKLYSRGPYGFWEVHTALDGPRLNQSNCEFHSCYTIKDFVKRDFPQYTWSIRTLDRRLRYFGIFYTDRDITVEQVTETVAKELEGPGRLLGYRAMQKKIRQEYHLNVPRDVVYATMMDLDPEELEERAIGHKKKKKKGVFTIKGTNWVHFLDGHGKLMGFQQNTYPLAVYGCIDTASRKLLWLKVWTRNCDPEVIGRWYLEWLYETRILPSQIRVDHGAETGVMATMHAYLRQYHDDMVIDPKDTVIFGTSTANQIERWWRELHERQEKYFKVGLSWLKDQGHYSPHDDTDRMLLAFIMVPLLQKEVDMFKDSVWNTHRIRAQRNTLLPDGIPDHIYSFPEQYGLQECGFQVTEEQLEEVAAMSGVLEVPDDFLVLEFRKKCEKILPDFNSIAADEFVDKFLFLKERYHEQ